MEKVEMTKEELNSFVKGIYLETVKELGLDKVDFKHKINPEDDEKKQLEKDPKYRMGMFVKAILSRNIESITKAADPNNETTAGEGGYLVPDVTRAEILRISESYGQVRPYLRVLPMGKSKVVNVPVENGGVTSYWVNENGSITSSKPTLAQVTLTAKKNGAIVVWSSELEEDSIVDWGNYMNYLVGKAFAKEEDNQFCVGTGSPIVGLYSTTHTFGNIVEVANPASITYKSMLDLINGIDSSKTIGGSLFMHRTILSKLREIVDTQERPLFVPAIGGNPNEIMGVPVRTFEYAPTASSSTAGLPLIIYGNLNNAILGTKREIRAEYSSQATVDGTSMFQNDLAGLKFTRRLAFTFAQPGECAVIKIATGA
jgi:HK97 family phage major capsid protein